MICTWVTCYLCGVNPLFLLKRTLRLRNLCQLKWLTLEDNPRKSIRTCLDDLYVSCYICGVNPLFLLINWALSLRNLWQLKWLKYRNKDVCIIYKMGLDVHFRGAIISCFFEAPFLNWKLLALLAFEVIRHCTLSYRSHMLSISYVSYRFHLLSM